MNPCKMTGAKINVGRKVSRRGTPAVLMKEMTSVRVSSAVVEGEARVLGVVVRPTGTETVVWALAVTVVATSVGGVKAAVVDVSSVTSVVEVSAAGARSTGPVCQ